MATSNNFLLKDLSGQIGKQLVIKQYDGKTVVSVYPDMSKQKFTAKQRRNQAVMEAANWEAKTIMADVELRNAAQVRLNVTANKLYTALVREYFQGQKEAGE
ncbi:hypothetical protein [Paraflavitalea pollutisoli]|uniref:hypothetical protein n=1 Tax=Paraflavitalea pollutisoli TaxID=3034143 RepID=UPI0023ED4614|nr:hypothetical protein [Paraflavitalea sp. H1-2-19X]